MHAPDASKVVLKKEDFDWSRSDPKLQAEAKTLFLKHTNNETVPEDMASYWSNAFDDDPGMSDFLNEAYESNGKFAIRVNPNTGLKEMMIAGSDTTGNWLQNVSETLPTNPFGGLSDVIRKDASAYYDEIAKQNDVDVIYGHSRGYAHLHDMESTAIKVGLNGANVLTEKDDTIVNVSGKGIFDQLVGSSNKTVDVSERDFHNVTRSKKRARQEDKFTKQVKRAYKKRPRSDRKFTRKRKRDWNSQLFWRNRGWKKNIGTYMDTLAGLANIYNMFDDDGESNHNTIGPQYQQRLPSSQSTRSVVHNRRGLRRRYPKRTKFINRVRY